MTSARARTDRALTGWAQVGAGRSDLERGLEEGAASLSILGLSERRRVGSLQRLAI